MQAVRKQMRFCRTAALLTCVSEPSDMRCCRITLRATGKKSPRFERRNRRWLQPHRNLRRLSTRWMKTWKLQRRKLQQPRSLLFFHKLTHLWFVQLFVCTWTSAADLCRGTFMSWYACSWSGSFPKSDYGFNSSLWDVLQPTIALNYSSNYTQGSSM